MKNPNEIQFINYNFEQWFHVFFGYNFANEDIFTDVLGPYVYPLWYVRDLFILFLFSPLIKKWSEKSPSTFLFTITFSYFLVIRPIFVNYQALFYFSVGMLWAQGKINLIEIADKIKWKELIPFFLVSWFVTNYFFTSNSTCNSFMVIFSCLIFLKLSGYLIKNEKIFSVTKYLSKFSFFLYAIHTPLLMESIKTIWLKLFPMKTPFFVLFAYFGITILVILFGTLAGIILKKICPPFFRVLNGGR